MESYIRISLVVISLRAAANIALHARDALRGSPNGVRWETACRSAFGGRWGTGAVQTRSVMLETGHNCKANACLQFADSPTRPDGMPHARCPTCTPPRFIIRLPSKHTSSPRRTANHNLRARKRPLGTPKRDAGNDSTVSCGACWPTPLVCERARPPMQAYSQMPHATTACAPTRLAGCKLACGNVRVDFHARPILKIVV